MDKEVSIVQYLPYSVLLYSCKISLHLDTTLLTISTFPPFLYFSWPFFCNLSPSNDVVTQLK